MRLELGLVPGGKARARMATYILSLTACHLCAAPNGGLLSVVACCSAIVAVHWMHSLRRYCLSLSQ